MNDIDAVLLERPEDSGSFYNKGLIFLEIDHFAEARAAFDRILDPEMRAKALLPHAAACHWSGDAAAAAELLHGAFSLESGDFDDIRKAELLCEVEGSLGREDSVEPLLEQALEQRREDPRLLGLAAMHREIRGEHDAADQLLLKAVELSTNSDRRELVWRLANFYGRLERFQEAADLYIDVVDGDVLHGAAMSLLVSLRNSGRLREALDWARTIREQHPRPPKLALETEAEILNHVGDVSSAAGRWADICSRDDATTLDRTKRAQALLWSGEREAALEAIREIDASSLRSDPQRLLSLAQLKRLLGESGYLDDAYMARRHGLDDPSVHLGYFALFMSQDKDTTTPEAVESGCAVLIKSESEEQWWVILDAGEEPREAREVAPEAELAQELLGQRRGDAVLIPQGVDKIPYEIVDIQSKYVRAFQTTALEFPKRFPRNTDLTRIPVSGSDFTQFFGLVDERDRFVRGLHDLYRDGQVPFAFLCAQLGRPAPEIWRACTESSDIRIRFGTGNEIETDKSAELLRDTDAIVLDMLALLTVHALDLADQLRRRFNRITVPQQVLDEIQQLVYEATLGAQPRGYVGKNIDGTYAWMEMSEEEWTEHQEFARSVLALAESFEPIPAYRALDAASDDLETLESALTDASVGALYAGGEDPEDRPLLVSDDLGLSAIARASRIGAVNTQAVLLELRREDVLTDEEYSSLIARLALLNYRFVRIEAGDILRLLEANGYMTDEGVGALRMTLRGRECTNESAVAVVAGLIAALVQQGLPVQQETLLVSVLLGDLRHGREMTTALVECLIALDVRLQNVPMARARVLPLVRDYIQIVDGGGGLH